ATLQAKVLVDILNEWAAQAIERRGVLRYDVHIPSAGPILPTIAGADDLFMAVNGLRSKAMQVLKATDDVMALPGAPQVRIGESGQSLSDVRGEVDGLLRYGVEPLTREI